MFDFDLDVVDYYVISSSTDHLSLIQTSDCLSQETLALVDVPEFSYLAADWRLFPGMISERRCSRR